MSGQKVTLISFSQHLPLEGAQAGKGCTRATTKQCKGDSGCTRVNEVDASGSRPIQVTPGVFGAMPAL